MPRFFTHSSRQRVSVLIGMSFFLANSCIVPPYESQHSRLRISFTHSLLLIFFVLPNCLQQAVYRPVLCMGLLKMFLRLFQIAPQNS